MNLDLLFTAKPLETAANRDIEEKRITKQDKDDLEKAITKELKRGWQVKSRSHDSDGTHGVTLFRKIKKLPNNLLRLSPGEIRGWRSPRVQRG